MLEFDIFEFLVLTVVVGAFVLGINILGDILAKYFN